MARAWQVGQAVPPARAELGPLSRAGEHRLPHLRAHRKFHEIRSSEGRDESRPSRQECLRHENGLIPDSTTSGVLRMIFREVAKVAKIAK